MKPTHIQWIATIASAIASLPLGCAHSCPQPPAPSPPATSPVVQAERKPIEKDVAHGVAYQGHGAGSVPTEILAKFRPEPLPSEDSRRIESLLDLRGPGLGRVSPGGKVLYFTWGVTGVSQVWKVEGAKSFPSQLTGGEDATIVQEVSPDGRFLVVSRDRKGEENPGLYIQMQAGQGGAAPSELITIQHKAGVQTHFGFISADSKAVYYSSNDIKPNAYAVYRYDIESKSRELLIGDDGLFGIVDHRDDGRLLINKSTGSLSEEYFEWSPKTRALTPLFGQGEHELYSAKYGHREGELVVLTNKFGNFRRLYSWSNGKFNPISDDVGYDVESFSIDPKRERILFELNDKGYTRLQGMDAKTYKALSLPIQRFKDADHVVTGTTSPDGRFTTIGVDDGRHWMQPFVIDWATKKIEVRHFPSTPEIDTATFTRATLDSFKSRDGVNIPVFVRKSAACEKAPSPCPVVIHFHGGPEAQTKPGFNVSAQAFVDAGFIFAEPNVRGSDGYGKQWLQADDKEKRLAVITDIEDAAAWAKSHFAIQGKSPRVGIFGGSYGGYSTLIGMTMFAGAYDAGVDVVGMSSLLTFMNNTAPYRRILRASEYGDPEKDRDTLIRLSPLTYIDKLKSPLFIIQGASDPRVPVGEAIQMNEELQKKGIPGGLMVFADEGHGAQKKSNRVLQLGHTIRFFKKHLM